MTAIVDYGVGNIFSLQSSLQAINIPCKVTNVQEELLQADHVILPGVGAFGDAMKKLEERNLDELLKKIAQKGTPLLGICLGMQLLFETSYEFGEHKGLGLIPGQVIDLKGALEENNFSYKVPHMGWNKLEVRKESALVNKIGQNEYVYYVHSFLASNCKEYTIAESEYGVYVPGIVENKNVFGAQFHPEKSGPVGLQILQSFCEL